MGRARSGLGGFNTNAWLCCGMRSGVREAAGQLRGLQARDSRAWLGSGSEAGEKWMGFRLVLGFETSEQIWGLCLGLREVVGFVFGIGSGKTLGCVWGWRKVDRFGGLPWG